jgi:hypothetical protein
MLPYFDRTRDIRKMPTTELTCLADMAKKSFFLCIGSLIPRRVSKSANVIFDICSPHPTVRCISLQIKKNARRPFLEMAATSRGRTISFI